MRGLGLGRAEGDFRPGYAKLILRTRKEGFQGEGRFSRGLLVVDLLGIGQRYLGRWL